MHVLTVQDLPTSLALLSLVEVLVPEPGLKPGRSRLDPRSLLSGINGLNRTKVSQSHP
jgi:hypothetical protein